MKEIDARPGPDAKTTPPPAGPAAAEAPAPAAAAPPAGEPRATGRDHEAETGALRIELVGLQHELKAAERSVLVLLCGDDRVGVDDAVRRLHEWMDARFLATQVVDRPRRFERERPWFWRHWLALPRRGQVGLHVGAWPLHALRERILDGVGGRTFRRRIEEACMFERTLVADGTVLLKLWIDLPRKALRRRLERARRDPDVAWRYEESDWTIYDHDARVRPLVRRWLAGTDAPGARWRRVDGRRAVERDLAIGRAVRDALLTALGRPPLPAAAEEEAPASAESPAEAPAAPTPAASTPAAPASAEPAPAPSPLAAVDLAASIDVARYERRLEKLQTRVGRAAVRAHRAGTSSVIVFEGWDASGKGGAIRRLTWSMRPRDYHVVPIAAPTDEERAHHYLWRFWRRLPGAGDVVIFDRSWYGRVLVERVEGFCPEPAWRRAYDEIVDFESQLIEHGYVLVKFWLHIDAEEQLERFRAREGSPEKRFKIGPEDWRNRSRWADYEAAVTEMIARTSTADAPWTVVPANDKRIARVTVLREVARRLERAL